MKTKFWAGSILWGGMLALGLSYYVADYTSSELHRFYHDWTGWRAISGKSPNFTTEILSKVIWAVVFCSCWWMLWRLDLFLANRPKQESPKFAKEAFHPFEDSSESVKSHDHTRTSEKDPNGKDSRTPEPEEKMDGENDSIKKEPCFEEMEMIETLGLSEASEINYEIVKSAYRIAIAQYHPDKVLALGPEIRKVAESKAKEINRAHEYFRRKFKSES